LLFIRRSFFFLYALSLEPLFAFDSKLKVGRSMFDVHPFPCALPPP